MNNQEKNLSLTNFGLTQLNEQEMNEANGGSLLLFLGAVSGVALLAYGAGYLYGTLTCDQK